jgi:hypothetical protein
VDQDQVLLGDGLVVVEVVVAVIPIPTQQVVLVEVVVVKTAIPRSTRKQSLV